MIIVFGSISMDMRLGIDSFSDDNNQIFASHRGIYPGGKGSNQAIAAARSGAKVALIGKVGDDEFATTLLNKMRREGITTSGISQSDELPTGSNIHIEDASGKTKSYYVPAANSEASAGQVPEETLNDKAFVLTQTEVTPDENILLLSKAKECGATTIMNLSPSLNLSQKALDHLDYLIVNQEEARQLATKIGLQVEDDALKLAEGLSKQGDLTCIITIGTKGSVAYTAEGKGWSVKALDVEEIVDRTGAQDAYCGTFAACLQAGMTLPRSMKRASIAGSLACTKAGGSDSLPTQENIETHINDLDDPEEISG